MCIINVSLVPRPGYEAKLMYTNNLIPGFVIGFIGHLACSMSHSLANCCHKLGSVDPKYFPLLVTGSACRSSVVTGTGYFGVGRQPSAAASPLVVDQLYWDARLSRLLR